MPLLLGVDPGSRQVGLGLLRVEGRRPSFVAAHILKLQPRLLGDRLAVLLENWEAYLAEWKPDLVVMEDQFFAQNVKSLVVLSRVSGALLGHARWRGYPVELYSPAVIKKTVTGTGQATKDQVEYMVKRFLGLSGDAPPDALDALAAALCHAHSAGLC